MVQANKVKDLLLGYHPQLTVEIVVIKTTGDMILDQNLNEIGGKGLFIKEIEEQLLAGKIDIAVHSMKDLPAFLPDTLEVCCVLPREDAADALLCHIAETINDLPEGCVVGTSSPRRTSQLLHMRPDIKVVPFRGNVQTRMKKLFCGEVDATFLAMAGLKRLNITGDCIHPLDIGGFIPAVGQGAIGIEIRHEDDDLKVLLKPLNCQDTSSCVAAERAFLAEFEGSCHTPVAAHATLLSGGYLSLMCHITKPDGSVQYRTTHTGADPLALGVGAAEELRTLGGEGFFDV